MAIELGENLADYTQKKFKTYDDFYLVKGDFESYDFGFYKFDLIFSASTIQWILEQIAFSKTYELLKKNGMLAMMMLRGDYKTPNEALYYEIQKVYAKHFHPETPYTQKINYGNVVDVYKRQGFASGKQVCGKSCGLRYFGLISIQAPWVKGERWNTHDKRNHHEGGGAAGHCLWNEKRQYV